MGTTQGPEGLGAEPWLLFPTSPSLQNMQSLTPNPHSLSFLLAVHLLG